MRRQVCIFVILVLAGAVGSLTGSLVTMYCFRDKSNRETPEMPLRFVRPHIEAGYDVHTSDPILKEEAEITLEKCLFLVSGALEAEREPETARQILRSAQAALEEAAKTAIKELEGGDNSGKRLIKWCPFWQQHVRLDHADGRNTSQEDYTFCGSTWQEVDRKLNDHLKSCPFDSIESRRGVEMPISEQEKDEHIPYTRLQAIARRVGWPSEEEKTHLVICDECRGKIEKMKEATLGI